MVSNGGVRRKPVRSVSAGTASYGRKAEDKALSSCGVAYTVKHVTNAGVSPVECARIEE